VLSIRVSIELKLKIQIINFNDLKFDRDKLLGMAEKFRDLSLYFFYSYLLGSNYDCHSSFDIRILIEIIEARLPGNNLAHPSSEGEDSPGNSPQNRMISLPSTTW